MHNLSSSFENNFWEFHSVTQSETVALPVVTNIDEYKGLEFYSSSRVGEITSQIINELKSTKGMDLIIDGQSFVSPPAVKSLPTPERMQILQKWQGTVWSIDEVLNEFTAQIVDKTNPDNPIELVTISNDELSNQSLSLLNVGAIFYWSIGYELKGATKKKTSVIHFSRLKNFSSRHITEAKEYGQELEELFSAN
jgi:hypothetical protein